MIANESPSGKVPGPKEYAAAGFRILPIASDGTKKPLVSAGTFGKEHPDFTVAPEHFPAGAMCAILTGPTPRWVDDGSGAWLMVLDLDGETTISQVDDWVGEPLPGTLTSKGGRHLYFKVPQSEARAALRQWVRVFGRTEGAPALDLKWDGGYAIEPAGAWDGGKFNPDLISTLPSTWIRGVLELRNARPEPSQSPGAAQTGGEHAPMGDVDNALASALGAVWPQPGEGCHEAALALGGILADSHWDLDDIARFAGAIFLASNTKNRVSDVLHSVQTKRNGGECKGWPSLKSILKDVDRGDWNAALNQLKKGVPGLSAPKVDLPAAKAAKQKQRRAKQQEAEDRGGMLAVGDAAEVASLIAAENYEGRLVADEGELWFPEPNGTWRAVPEDETSRACVPYSGRLYETPEGKMRCVMVSSGFCNSVRQIMVSNATQPRFFAEAPAGLAFQNGFLALNRKPPTFEPIKPEHKVRHVLPCDYGLDAARKAPPVNWVRYLRSVWGQDIQSIELVHQLLGYLLSGRHDMQKIFVLLGPPRAGKGTLLNLIKAIFRDQCCAFKVASLDATFSLQGMLGKSVAFDPDVRRASSMFKSEGQVVERLLSISAHDYQSIPRKNTTDANTALPTRLLLAANPPFGLSDVGGALASRMVILTFPKSFLGSEDTTLLGRLEAEIPSIVALALDGLARLDQAGHFKEPDSSAEERESVERAQNPMLGFFDEVCELGPDFTVASEELWLAAVKWRDANGHKRQSSQAFAEFLRQKGIKQIRPKSHGERMPRVYQGIRLRGVGGARLSVVPDPNRPVGTTRPNS
jgi:P4 family phage/plasmid primase-like protien